MTHPGLPEYWLYSVWFFMLLISAWILLRKIPEVNKSTYYSLNDKPFVKSLINFLTQSVWPLFLLKIIAVGFFILVIVSGLKGTPIPERNIATVLTWNIWWSGLIVSVFFFGSAWCSICPWDALATWMVRPRLWLNKNIKFNINNSLELKPPKWMRSVWPALIMFIGLTWLELGVGVTSNPYWTALLSLLMLVLATISLALFKNKAFCHYICPVGRTVGFYSQLAPIELRPINNDICASCTTLECFNGTKDVDACPTQLVMGRLTQNTYCTSCGNCTKSCPEKNVAWRLRPQSNEAIQSARPHWDEAWFMLALLALTSFHGITMLEFWEGVISNLAQKIGDSGQLLISFSLGLFISMVIPVIVYAIVILITQYILPVKIKFKKLFTSLVFVTLPLAFAYHLAHNLNHMIRESVGLQKIFYNPYGLDALPMTASEVMYKHHNMLISQSVLFSLQALLMMFGFWISVKILRYRSNQLLQNFKWRIIPMLIFIMGINGFNLWMLSQPMIMRFGSTLTAQQ